jgi:hypothetical protein
LTSPGQELRINNTVSPEENSIHTTKGEKETQQGKDTMSRNY